MRKGLTVAEAQEAILQATPVLASQRVGLSDALHRILAEDVSSHRQLPPADCSAMDGYAVRHADCRGATAESPATLRVCFEVAAGHGSERVVETGTAARIFTGAPIPPGADAVVRQEDTETVDGSVRIRVEPATREHVRDAGEDLQVGDSVLSRGDRIRPGHIGTLASLGRTGVAVTQRPRVGILSGGDELVEPDGDIAGGRIVSSNSYTLSAACVALGAEPIYLGIARDTPEDLEHLLRGGLQLDCLISSAGVSVGDHDYVRPVLEKLGCELVFWGVHMKPGFPLTFGRFHGDTSPGPLVFGLPGNPVSASVTFDQFVRPALRKMMGHTRLFLPTVKARLLEPLDKKAGRLHFVRVALEWRDGEVWALTTGNQSSGVMTSLVRAHGLVVFPADATSLGAGETVTVQVLDDDFFHGETRGFDV